MTIKELREKYNLSQRELAEKIGTSPACISTWERGLHKMSSISKNRIASHFGISPMEIEEMPFRPKRFIDKQDQEEKDLLKRTVVSLWIKGFLAEIAVGTDGYEKQIEELTMNIFNLFKEGE